MKENISPSLEAQMAEFTRKYPSYLSDVMLWFVEFPRQADGLVGESPLCSSEVSELIVEFKKRNWYELAILASYKKILLDSASPKSASEVL